MSKLLAGTVYIIFSDMVALWTASAIFSVGLFNRFQYSWPVFPHSLVFGLSATFVSSYVCAIFFTFFIIDLLWRRFKFGLFLYSQILIDTFPELCFDCYLVFVMLCVGMRSKKLWCFPGTGSIYTEITWHFKCTPVNFIQLMMQLYEINNGLLYSSTNKWTWFD